MSLPLFRLVDAETHKPIAVIQARSREQAEQRVDLLLARHAEAPWLANVDSLNLIEHPDTEPAHVPVFFDGHFALLSEGGAYH